MSHASCIPNAVSAANKYIEKHISKPLFAHDSLSLSFLSISNDICNSKKGYLTVARTEHEREHASHSVNFSISFWLNVFPYEFKNLLLSNFGWCCLHLRHNRHRHQCHDVGCLTRERAETLPSNVLRGIGIQLCQKTINIITFQ